MSLHHVTLGNFKLDRTLSLDVIAVYCDRCDGATASRTEDKEKAVEYAVEEGWRVVGEQHICPCCQPMRVYIAGTRHDPRIADGSLVAELLEDYLGVGVEVVSRWHDNPPGDQNGTLEERLRVCTQNFHDLDTADVVLAVPCETHHLRGAHVEVGYATGRGIPVVILGESGDFNTMTETSTVRYADSVEMALREMVILCGR